MRQCDEIEKTIERYRRMQRTILDQAFIERAKELIAETEADTAACHPPPRSLRVKTGLLGPIQPSSFDEVPISAHGSTTASGTALN